METRAFWDIIESARSAQPFHEALGGGCPDDSFTDFRAGLIAEGRGWYEKVMSSPDSLAGHPAVIGETGHTLFYEDVNYAALHAFERITGSKEDILRRSERLRRPARQRSGHG